MTHTNIRVHIVSRVLYNSHHTCVYYIRTRYVGQMTPRSMNHNNNKPLPDLPQATEPLTPRYDIQQRVVVRCSVLHYGAVCWNLVISL